MTPRPVAGLTDDEYRWEPAPGAWSVRPRGEAAAPRPWGAGDWQIDWDRGHPEPEPVTTIAWRLGHLISMYKDRWEWTFGSRSIDSEVNTGSHPVRGGGAGPLSVSEPTAGKSMSAA